MASPWQLLRAGGLPLAIEPAAVKPSEAQLASAVHAAVAESPVGRDAEALAALIVAWRHHWPAAFAHAFGDGDALEAWATAQLPDDNRYLKLRRIAIENLSHVL